ncbi:hypothetical protein [Longimicrobium sp.]|uniref:hypothetical protein n=1 Tax=Longimicrobium sp. TaxID=2029185 RepID=UPI003B3B2286
MPVTPLDYRQLRLLAEAALGQPSGESVFTFNGSVVELVPPEHQPPPDGILIPTVNRTKRPSLSYLTLQVPWTTPDGTRQLVSLDALDFHADAVFWSEAAVMKFVQPYCASCAGSFASDELALLRRAWNGSAQGARVFAMLHVTWSAPGGPTPIEPLWVAFLRTEGEDAGTVGALPVSGYIAEFDPDVPVEMDPLTVPYVRPLPTPAAVSLPGYSGLRGVAEWSASLTGGPMYFLYDPATGTYNAPSATLPPVVGSQIVIPVHNQTVPPERLLPVGVWLQAPGGTAPVDLAGTCDAVFWSTGAIEQFMLPYYASVDGFAGLVDLGLIALSWTDNVSAGAGGLQVAPGPVLGPTLLDDGNQEVYALVHMPKSAWVSLEESVATAEIAMVHGAGASGRTAVTSARQFIAKARR